MDGGRGDLAEFGEKRNTYYDFPPPLYVDNKYAENKNWKFTSGVS